LTQKFTGPATFKSLNNELKLEIQLECHTKWVIEYFDTMRTSNSFCRKIPSVMIFLFKQ
jgi:hypothetical protein